MRVKWIPCADRLPAKSGVYLVHTMGGDLQLYPYSTKYQAFNVFDEYADGTAAVSQVKCRDWMEEVAEK